MKTLKKRVERVIEFHFPLLRQWYRNKIGHGEEWQSRKAILNYYKSNKAAKQDKDIEAALKYIRKKGIHIFPYPFIEKYTPGKIKIHKDKECGLKYVIHNGKRLYYPRETRTMDFQSQYSFLISEQDKQSPHCYETDTFGIEEGDILFDIGAAEGIYALNVIEKIKKVYLFEVEERWIEALRQTFKPWADKVEIFNKYMSDTDSENTAKIDTLVKDLKDGSLLLKMDVEGAESSVIDGAKETLTSDNFKVKAVICTYHNKEDHEVLSKKMKGLGYNVETSKGYMLFEHEKRIAPYFRHGLIYCRKR